MLESGSRSLDRSEVVKMSEIASHWSGIILILGAALLGIAIVIISLRPVMGVTLSPGAAILMLLSAILLLLSLPTMYARQANAAGWLGFAGYGLLQAGILVLVLAASTPLLQPAPQTPPGESWTFFLLGIALTLGLLLTGIATIRADVYPRGAGVLLLAAMAGFFFVFFVAEFLPPITGQVGSAIFGILLALSLAWIGVALVKT
jgi:hypothetical protein